MGDILKQISQQSQLNVFFFIPFHFCVVQYVLHNDLVPPGNLEYCWHYYNPSSVLLLFSCQYKAQLIKCRNRARWDGDGRLKMNACLYIKEHCRLFIMCFTAQIQSVTLAGRICSVSICSFGLKVVYLRLAWEAYSQCVWPHKYWFPVPRLKSDCCSCLLYHSRIVLNLNRDVPHSGNTVHTTD